MGTLTRNQVRQANKTYKQDHKWDAYLELARKPEDGRLLRKQKVIVVAKSRDEAFDKIRARMVNYNKTHKKTIAVGRGVAHAPRLSR